MYQLLLDIFHRPHVDGLYHPFMVNLDQGVGFGLYHPFMVYTIHLWFIPMVLFYCLGFLILGVGQPNVVPTCCPDSGICVSDFTGNDSLTGLEVHVFSIKLVGGDWNMDFMFPYIGNVIIPIDEVIFFRGVQTTNQKNISSVAQIS